MSVRLSRKTKLAWIVVALLALVSALCGITLVGYSTWFLSTVSVVGLGSLAYAFNFHIPAAIIRALALTRVGSGLVQQLAGHWLALKTQAQHRVQQLENAFANYDAKASNWQLARGDSLQSFIERIEAIEYHRLRVWVPAVTLATSACTLLIGTALFIDLSLAFLVLALLMLTTLAGLAPLWLCDAKHLLKDQDSRLQIQGGDLADVAFSRRSLLGSDEITARMDTWLDDEALSETQRLTVERHRKGGHTLSLLFGILGVGAILVAASALSVQPSMGLFIAFSFLALSQIAATTSAIWIAHMKFANALEAFQQPTPTSRPPQVAPPPDVLAQTIESGKRVAALSGQSGSGKSLALKGLDQNLRDRGQSVTLILHDNAILTGTWRDNLTSPGAHTPDSQIWAALEAVELAQRCAQDDQGLDAWLDGQSSLSSGEAHRLNLARGVLSQTDWLLIDEPGEHLGKDQQLRIFEQILPLVEGRKILFASHDPRLLALASTTFPVHVERTNHER